MTSRKWTIQLKLFQLKFAEKIRTLLFLSVHFTKLVPMRKKSNVSWKSGIVNNYGDFNINLNNNSGESTQRYKQILHSFSLKQHINKPTRKNKTLIDHICSNIPTKVVRSDVLHTDEISEQDMPYAILNVKKERYEQRYKCIRNEKDININLYVSDF